MNANLSCGKCFEIIPSNHTFSAAILERKCWYLPLRMAYLIITVSLAAASAGVSRAVIVVSARPFLKLCARCSGESVKSDFFLSFIHSHILEIILIDCYAFYAYHIQYKFNIHYAKHEEMYDYVSTMCVEMHCMIAPWCNRFFFFEIFCNLLVLGFVNAVCDCVCVCVWVRARLYT